MARASAARMHGPSPGPPSDPALPDSARASLSRASGNCANTLPPFLLSGLHGVEPHAGWGYGWTLLLVLPTAALYVRLFIIQHDCGHGSYFASARANHWVGACLGLITLFPFATGRRPTPCIMAPPGNLDQRELGDIRTLTVSEYRARSRWGRFCYRFYRSMPVMLGIGPTYQFLIKHRFPLDLPWSLEEGVAQRALNNLIAPGRSARAVPGSVGTRCCACICQWCRSLVRSACGCSTYSTASKMATGRDGERWDPHHAAIAGSSYYDLPRVLHWFTGNIGYHHIHHLAPRIPNYRLRAAFESSPAAAASAVDPAQQLGMRAHEALG